jgi:hypothetical protein
MAKFLGRAWKEHRSYGHIEALKDILKKVDVYLIEEGVDEIFVFQGEPTKEEIDERRR